MVHIVVDGDFLYLAGAADRGHGEADLRVKHDAGNVLVLGARIGELEERVVDAVVNAGAACLVGQGAVCEALRELAAGLAHGDGFRYFITRCQTRDGQRREDAQDHDEGQQEGCSSFHSDPPGNHNISIVHEFFKNQRKEWGKQHPFFAISCSCSDL